MPRVPPQTTKQAKAAHKARGQPALTAAERRKLDRDILLHSRAWATEDREKSNARAAQKRFEREQREKDDLSNPARFATQRRLDRFGHKSSQCHLGAFFTSGHARPQKSALPAVDQTSYDSGLDDDTLLAVLKTPKTRPRSPQHQTAHISSIRQHGADDAGIADADGRCCDDHDLAIVWSDFDSSTQIAKDLAVAGSQLAYDDRPRASTKSPASVTISSLDMMTQEIEELDQLLAAADQAQKTASVRQHDLSMLPPSIPPQLPAKRKLSSFDGQLDGAIDYGQDITNSQLEACLNDGSCLDASISLLNGG